MTQTYLGGVTRDRETGKFVDAGREPTSTLTIRLPESLKEKIKKIPDRQDWLREVLANAVESLDNE